ncbi:MAG: aldehyde dehydrogenase [Phycisphaerales bacterium]|nr:aldehyde dehydrogenase [Phycisphaerales bacterium]
MGTLQSRHSTAQFLWNARHAWLRKFEAAVAFHALEMAQQISDEIGKPREEAYVSELLPLIASIRWHRKCARAILKSQRMGGKPWWMMGRSLRLSRVPLGRVLIIATWNYPVGLLGIQLLQAIVAGNTVVVKPSERSPRSQGQLLDIAQACGLPDGVLRVIGSSPQAGRDALETGGFDHVIFTGGTSTGRAVAAHCAETLTPSTLELSGQDSAFVLEDANVIKAAKSIWMACTMNAGQTCMAPRRVFVQRGCYKKFLEALAPHAAGARPVQLIDHAAAQRCEELARQAVASGGRSLSAVMDGARAGWLRPLAIVDCPMEANLVEGNYFGPVISVVPVDHFEQAIEFHGQGNHHLAASIFTRDTSRIARDDDLKKRLGVSVITLNDCVLPTGHPALAIAGFGQSGWGTSRGVEGLLHLTRAVATTTTARWLPVADMPSVKVVQGLSTFIKWMSQAKPVAWKKNLSAPKFERVREEHEMAAAARKELSK